MRTPTFTTFVFALLLFGCASLPGHVPGQSLANRVPRFVRLALQSILASEALHGQSGQFISVKNTQVLEGPDKFYHEFDSQTQTGTFKWVERWTIQCPTGIVTYRVTFDARGSEGMVVGAIQEDSNGQPKIPILELDLNKK